MIDYFMDITLVCDVCGKERGVLPTEYASDHQLLVGFDFSDSGDWEVSCFEVLCPDCKEPETD